MKVLWKSTIIALIALGIFVSPGFSNPCENSIKAFKHSLNNEPDEMTLEFIDSALEMCTKKHDIYKEAAAYYKHWYKKELNPAKQIHYKELAQTYYRKAMAIKGSDKINRELVALSSQRNFNIVAFRALRPSTVGAVNTGLDMRINFKRNSHELTGSTSILDQLGEIMKDDKNVTISLEGHTDQTGTLAYNNQLSIQRARTVRAYISENYDIEPSRMKVAGYGYKHLVDPKNPAGELNRRVEVIKLSD